MDENFRQTFVNGYENRLRRRMKVQNLKTAPGSIFSGKRQGTFAVLCLYFCFLLPSQGYSQNLSNLEAFYKLADSSVAGILKTLPKGNTRLQLKLDLPEGYSVFRNKIIQELTKNGKNVLFSSDSLAPMLNIGVDRAIVVYSSPFRKGFWGSYKSGRTVSLRGNFVLAEGGHVSKAENFSFARTDTVMYDDLRSLEDPSIPFTRGDIPPEPLFSTLWEPVVALGTAAVAVYLFFTVRSK